MWSNQLENVSIGSPFVNAAALTNLFHFLHFSEQSFIFTLKRVDQGVLNFCVLLQLTYPRDVKIASIPLAMSVFGLLKNGIDKSTIGMMKSNQVRISDTCAFVRSACNRSNSLSQLFLISSMADLCFSSLSLSDILISVI